MKIPTTPQAVATHSGANAAALLFLAAYLSICLYQGNLSALADQARADFLGSGSGTPAFWRWAVALLILYALAQNSRTAFIFGPLLGFALVAMLIEMAMTQPQTFANLQSGLKSFFGQ